MSSTHASPERSTSGLVGTGERLFVAALLLNVVVVLSAVHFPYIDAVNHLARYVLIARSWGGDVPAYVDFELIPTPYIAIDLIGAGLVRLIGPEATWRLLGVISLTLPSVGLYALIRSVAPEARGWALVGTLTAFNSFSLVGLTSYLIGVGLALLWLAAWWPRRQSRSIGARIGMALPLVVLFFVHLSAPVIVLLVACIHLGVAGVASRGRGREWRAQAITTGVVTLPIALLALWNSHVSNAAGQILAAGHRPLLSELKQLLSPGYAIGYVQLGVLLTGYAVTLGGFIALRGRAFWRDSFTIASLAFVAGYFVAPAGHDVRWLLPAYLLPFAGATKGAAPSRALLAVAFGGTLAHAAVIHLHFRHVDRELQAYAEVLEQVPPGTRLLPATCCEGKGFPPVNPYRHYALWHVVRHGGRVAGLFSMAPIYDGQPPLTHFAHFRERSRLPHPGENRLTADPSDSAWTALLREYDFVVLAGSHDALRGVLEKRRNLLREVARRGNVRLYEVLIRR